MLDQESMFSWKQAVTGESVSTNIVDLGGPEAGGGQPSALEIITNAVPGGTLDITLQTSDTAASGWENVVTYSVPEAALKQGGAVAVLYIPSGTKQFARLAYSNGGAAGLEVTAGIVPAGQTNINTRFVL